MKTKLLTSLFFLLLCTAGRPLMGQNSFSLEEAVQYALKNSAQVKQNQLNLVDADAQLMEYKSIGIPKVNATIDFSHYFAIPTTILPDFLSPTIDNRLVHYNLLDSNLVEDPKGGGIPARFGLSNSLSGALAMNTILYDPSFFVGLKATKLYKELVTRQNSVSDITIRQSVAKAYLGALIAIRSKSILDQNIATLDKIVKETEAVRKQGFVEQLDVDRLSLSLQTMQLEAEKANRMTEITLNVLRMHMGFPFGETILLTENLDVLADRLKIDNADLVSAFRPEQRPEYRSMQMAEELSKIRMQTIKLSAYPVITGFANVSYGSQSNNLIDKDQTQWFPSSIAGFKLNLPIFDGFNRKARYQRANVELDKLRLQMNEFERAMNLEVSTARIQFDNARTTLDGSQRNLDLAQKIYDQAQLKYKGGIGSSLEINQAETVFLQAQSGYIQALYNMLVTKTDLDKALGK
ncbi:MAG TPA: TolC family protein [Saprospiraceae bacterium]|nr:TolC family protein [Saprospiraceae bacterium]HNT21031.1 TolC family protein [Saprospiraceae bacterium]